MNDTLTFELPATPRNGEAGGCSSAPICSAFRCIVADPPWPYRRKSRGFSWRKGRPSGEATEMLEYPTMTLDEIAALPVSKLAEDDAHIYVWTTQKYIWETPRIMEAWGFKPSMILTWCKSPFGFSLGDSYGLATEFCVFGRRGKLRPKMRTNRDWWNWKRGKHSAKPEEFQTVVESVSPGPYLELFARRKRHGWASWGNEIANDVEMPNKALSQSPENEPQR